MSSEPQDSKSQAESRHTQDVKPQLADREGDGAAEKITIKVTDEHDTAMNFKIKSVTPLGKVFEHYCSRSNLTRNDVRFYFDGIRLTDDTTPKSVEMKNGDKIEVMRNQIGGSW